MKKYDRAVQVGCHDTQRNDTQHSDSQHYDTE